MTPFFPWMFIVRDHIRELIHHLYLRLILLCHLSPVAVLYAFEGGHDTLILLQISTSLGDVKIWCISPQKSAGILSILKAGCIRYAMNVARMTGVHLRYRYYLHRQKMMKINPPKAVIRCR